MYDIVAFGEVQLRLATQNFERLEQATSLDVKIGGAELNVILASGGVPPSVAVVVLDAADHPFLRQSRPVAEDGRVTLPTIPAGVARCRSRARSTTSRRISSSRRSASDPTSPACRRTTASRSRVGTPSSSTRRASRPSSFTASRVFFSKVWHFGHPGPNTLMSII